VNKKMSSPRRNYGFTLYELLIVIAVLSIMSTMGTISLLSFKQRTQLLGLANTIKSDLNQGKILAAKYKSYVVLQMRDSDYELFVDNGAGAATPGDWIREGKERRIARREIDPTLALHSNFPGDHLRLRSGGRIRPGTISLSGRGGERIDVVINAVGRIRLEQSG